jgi:hypothetical protein
VNVQADGNDIVAEIRAAFAVETLAVHRWEPTG